jgi:hypothetical protein
VATQWSELVLHWYFLEVRIQKERNGTTFTCLTWSHQHGFHWTISKSSYSSSHQLLCTNLLLSQFSTLIICSIYFFFNLWLDLICIFGLVIKDHCCRGAGPSPRSNHVAALYDDRILLIFGGHSKSKTLNDLYSLDFETVSLWASFIQFISISFPCCRLLTVFSS